MARLTTFSRFLITAVIVAALFFAARAFLPGMKDKFGGETTTTGTTAADKGGAVSDANSSSTATAPATAPASSGNSGGSRRNFDYTPKTPVGGKLKGVVELGASGFNSFIITADAQKNWKLEKADYGASLVYEKLTGDEDVKSGLKAYIRNMLDFGVNPRDIHFVISSGAQKVDITKKIIEFLKGMGYVVNTVTPEQEGALALKSVLPNDYAADAFVVDIGSGNTKVSWIDNGKISAFEASGAKYFQNNVSDSQVYDETKRKAAGIPASHRKVCFIIGGVPFTLAKQTRDGKERFTVLKDPAEYQAGSDAKMKAGLNIYKAIADATDCQQFVFDWDANFTIGFLLDLK
ncbi:MAG: hypothetical protein IPL35_11380 [Sphingobacteriales bacterium]|nr:hypothetical protein [Sphingobacteriales bacterium]